MPSLPRARTDERTANAADRPFRAVFARAARRAWWIARSSALILAVAGTAACAAADGEPASAEVPEIQGELAPTIFGGVADGDARGASSVVALKVGTDGDYELCSGVLVAPNVVLTARHCVANNLTTAVGCDERGRSTNGKHVDGELPPASVAVYTGASARLANDPDAVGKAIVAPKGDVLCDSDIALVVLDRGIADVEPLAVRLEVGVTAGETIRSVGYGQNDRKMPLGTRLRKTGVAVLAMGSRISDSDTPLGPHEFEVGRSICEGDSGGPAISEDTGAVVGVVSRGGNCNQDFGHVYTTTAGWGALFDEAFMVAGGAPIVESGRPVGIETGADESPVLEAPASIAPAETASCALGPAGSRAGGWLGLALGCAALAAGAARRERRS